MIHRIGSDLSTFKTLVFGPGLNILLADKSKGATDKHSRNGAGKTSLVEIIHFLLGADSKPESIFRSDDLQEFTFEMDFDLAKARVSASRSGARPSKVMVNADVSNWPRPGRFNQQAGLYEFANEAWKDVLGHYWFGLSESDSKYEPSYRSLFSYFARRQLSGGFHQPWCHSIKQQAWDCQVSISYLLGLDWTIAARFQRLREQEQLGLKFRGAAKSGSLGGFYGKSGNFRTKLAVAESRYEALRKQIMGYNVVPEYKSLESEANEITQALEVLNLGNISDAGLLSQLRGAITEEPEVDSKSLLKLYEDAGVVLPGAVVRRFEEVAHFHRTMVSNRKRHLEAEIDGAEQRIKERDSRKEELDARRRQIMEILQSGGALEQYLLMREELGRAYADVESLRQKLEAAEALERTRSQIIIERERLGQEVQSDIQDRQEVIKDAILTFERLSEALYERAGSLTISPTKNGPEFEVRIDGQRSKGITNMQIFCFDLMLAEIATKTGRGPGFLVHDSHLFDGVDERQVAKALKLGAQRAAAVGFQYIVTMNSDDLPGGETDGFNPRDFVMAQTLTDATDIGGLFGMRFE